MLPMIAVGTDSLVRRWRVITPLVAIVVLAGVPANIRRFDDDSIFNSHYYERQRQLIFGITRDPLFASAAEWIRFEPDIYNGGSLTVGWMRAAMAEGKVPNPGPVSQSVAREFSLRLALVQDDAARPGWFVLCEERTEPVDLTLVQGDQIRIYSDVSVTRLDSGRTTSVPLKYVTQDGQGVLTVAVPEIEIRLSAVWGAGTYKACKVE